MTGSECWIFDRQDPMGAEAWKRDADKVERWRREALDAGGGFCILVYFQKEMESHER